MQKKTCARCKKLLEVSLFKHDSKARDGLKSWCQPCFKEYDHERGLLRSKTHKIGHPRKVVEDGQVRCPTCHELKPSTTEYFARDITISTGLRPRCKACDSVFAKEYHRKNKEKRVQAATAWKRENRDRNNASKRIWLHRWINESQQNRLSVRLRVRLANAVRQHIKYMHQEREKAASAVCDLGCTLDELVVHLEKQFHPGMSWDNYGKWHIDHIRPLASFDLTDVEQCRQAVHYTNLQPLWAVDNLRKGTKLPPDLSIYHQP